MKSLTPLASFASFAPFKLAALAVATLAIHGCSTQQKSQALHTDTAQAASQITAEAKQRVRDSEKLRVAQQDVDKPYLVGKPTPLARDVALPEAFRQKATVLFDRAGVDLPTALRQMSDATRMPMSATPDALMPASAFAMRAGQAGAVQSGPVAKPIMLSSMPGNVPVYALLDEVARQAGVSWRVAGAGAEFYRVETRVFKINTSPQSASANAALGRNSTANSVFEATSKTDFKLDSQNPFTGMRTTVEAMLTVGGRMTASPESQTIVVTDTPQALAQVQSYIDDMNKSLGRRVRVIVEAIEVSSKENSELGLDWSVVYRSLANAAPSPANLTQAAIGSLVGSTASTTTITSGGGRFEGSAAAVRALSEIGNITNRRSFPFITSSGRPITAALRNTFNYIDSASAAPSTSLTTTAQAPTATQKDETVGNFLTVLPIAKDNGQLFVSVSYDVTTADPIKSQSVGSGNNAVIVQQKSLHGTGMIAEFPMRSGQTVVAGGFDTIAGSNTERRLAPGASLAFGGSNLSGYQKSVVVVLVTAVTEDGY